MINNNTVHRMVNLDKEDLIIHESTAIIKHLDFLQSIISRMAGNSASCKTWAITIASALFALLYKGGLPIVIVSIPVFLFYMMDSIYLGLEEHFRKLYEQFVKNLSNGDLQKEDVYSFSTKPNIFNCLRYGMNSFSTWVFYLPVLLLIVLDQLIICLIGMYI